MVDGARARARAYERIREEIAQGRQCFVVCPLVEESEALQAKAATAEFERLRTTEFADLRVELIHGQMPSKQKAAAMKKFAAGEADVLVATSVIEVGIDVPNATVMLIEAAERYGLSQLHQLRGRVGRGEHASLCIVFGDPTLPRLEAIARERDGFRLAEVDLELRGAGDVLGTRQHGLPEFRVARLPEDVELLVRARDRADQILIDDPRLEQPEHALLREAVVARFGSELDPLASRPGELVDPVLMSAALARAADAAYASVRDPAEGTMLSAVRVMASRVAHDLAHMDTQRLGPEATAEEQDELLAEVLENALEAGKEAVERGPEQLAVLRESGVVDAGAYGLTVIIAGCLAGLRGLEAPKLEHQYAPAALHRPEHESSSFQYCTNFAVTGERLEAGHFTPLLEQLGDSVLVVGDDRTLRVHVHTDDPDAAVALFDSAGEVSRFDVADMYEQVAERNTRLGAERRASSWPRARWWRSRAARASSGCSASSASWWWTAARR